MKLDNQEQSVKALYSFDCCGHGNERSSPLDSCLKLFLIKEAIEQIRDSALSWIPSIYI